jgi:hypothetical protein
MEPARYRLAAAGEKGSRATEDERFFTVHNVIQQSYYRVSFMGKMEF